MVTKQFLSGSTNGRGIKLAATGTPGTLLHTATNIGGEKDEVYLYLVNSHSAAVTVTLEVGGVTDPDDRIAVTLAPQSALTLVLPGFVYDGGVAIRAFASVANVVMAHGYVHRIAE